MATLGARFIDMIDLLKAQEGGEPAAYVVEMLSQTNPILDDCIWLECNKGQQHLTTIRNQLPQVAWGQIYKGIPQSKSGRSQVTDTTGFVEGLSSVDVRLLETNKKVEAAFRLSEGMGYIEAMNQQMASTIFYGSTLTNPERFHGLAPRYNLASASGLANDSSRNVVSAGGNGSTNTSIWIVTWGPMFTHGLYPEGTKAGIDRQDKGEQPAWDENGAKYFVKEELYRWYCGLTVRDWRYNARVCNIDLTALRAGSVDLFRHLRRAYYQMQRRKAMGPGASIMGAIAAPRTVVYCNKEILEALEALSVNRGSSDNYIRLRPDEVAGSEVWTYKNLPIRECDALLNTELAVPVGA